MHLPPWLAGALAVLRQSDIAEHAALAFVQPPVASSLPDPVFMATGDGAQHFLVVDKAEQGATARLVKASLSPPTAWIWAPNTASRPDHVRIYLNGSDPALCLAAPVDPKGTPKAGDLVLVPCTVGEREDRLAGHESRDPGLWTQTPELSGTTSFHLPKGLFMGFSGDSAGATNNYFWSSEWVGLSAKLAKLAFD